MAHDRGTEDDTSNDFCNDSRFMNIRQWYLENSGEDDDDQCLEQKKLEGIASIKRKRIVPRKDRGHNVL